MRIHSTCLLALPLLLSGCQTHPGGAPLLSADRVPPPATRVPPSGTATPYYPGTPAPALPLGAQAAPPATVEPVVRPEVNRLPSTGVAIALPSDNQPLRIAPTYTPPNHFAAQPVSPTAPPASAAPPSSPSPSFTPPAADRQLAWSGGAPATPAYQPVVPYAVQPYAAAQPAAGHLTTGQPATGQLAPTTPRVRLPGYATPVQYLASAPAGSTGTPMVAPAPHPVPAVQPAPVAGDGFRPRGSATSEW